MRVVLGEAPGAAGGCAVVGAVDGARAADLFGEVEDDSLGWRRNAALAFDETNFDDSVLDMERVVVLSLVLFDPAFAPVAWTSGPCDLLVTYGRAVCTQAP